LHIFVFYFMSTTNQINTIKIFVVITYKINFQHILH